MRAKSASGSSILPGLRGVLRMTLVPRQQRLDGPSHVVAMRGHDAAVQLVVGGDGAIGPPQVRSSGRLSRDDREVNITPHTGAKRR